MIQSGEYLRPPFVRQIDNCGYILEEISSVIIIKGGKIIMPKTIRKPLEGFDSIFDELEALRDALENDKQAEIDAFTKQIQEKYAEKEKRILSALENVSTEEVVEEEEVNNLEEVHE